MPDFAVPARAAGDRPTSLWRWPLAIMVASALLFAVAAAFPWGVLISSGIVPLSRIAGRPVTFTSARRVDWFSLTPTIELRDLAVAQPSWVGHGVMGRVREARITAPVLPLIFGRFHPHAIDLAGLQVALFRDAAGRANWSSGRTGGAGRPPLVSHVTITDGQVHLIDLRRRVVLDGTLASTARGGLVLATTGTLRQRPLRLELAGGALGEADPGKPYPVRVRVRSPLVAIDAVATLDHPLDTQRFSARVATTGRDLSFFDDIVQAGLFPTQPYSLTGAVRRDGDHWVIRRLAGRVGRSRLIAQVDVRRQDGRTRLKGSIDAERLDFDDFASDAQRAAGAARARATGPRLLPATVTELDHIARLDGSLHVTVHQLLGGRASPFRTLSGDATLDHQRLTLAPLAIGLVSGRATGSLIDDDRHGVPHVTLDLRVARAAVQALIVKSGTIQGPLAMRVRLEGSGSSFRAAMANASGRVGAVISDGTIRADDAIFVGGDVLKSIGVAVKGGQDRVALRCLVGDFAARDGRLVPSPLVIDTAVSRADGSGSIDLHDERIDLSLHGRSKRPGPLQSTAPTRLSGTLLAPKIDIKPPRASDQKKIGTLARVGFFLKGLRVRTGAAREPPPNADCGALAAHALR